MNRARVLVVFSLVALGACTAGLVTDPPGGTGAPGPGTGGPVDAGTDGGRDAGVDGGTRDGGPVDAGQRAAYVAVGYGTRRLWSLDGRAWTEAPKIVHPPWWDGGADIEPVSGDNEWLLRGACSGNGLVIAVGGTGGDRGMVLRSTDGIAWEVVPQTQANDDCAFGNGVFTTGRRVSTDGRVWSLTPTPPDAVRRIAFGAGRFVAVGDQGGGSVATSTDGRTWTQLPIAYASGTDSNRLGYTTVVFGGGRFHAIKTCCVSDPRLFEWDGVDPAVFTETRLADLRTLDGGVLFTAGSGFGFDLAYGRGALWIVEDDRAWRRADGQSVWTEVRWEAPAAPGGGVVHGAMQNAVVGPTLIVSPTAYAADPTAWTAAPALANDQWPPDAQPYVNETVEVAP